MGFTQGDGRATGRQDGHFKPFFLASPPSTIPIFDPRAPMVPPRELPRLACEPCFRWELLGVSAMLPDVHVEQEHELRKWAARLTDTAEVERRSLGRAILMLLDQVDSLRADLERCRIEALPDDGVLPGVDTQVTPEPSPDDRPTMDLTTIGIRDRLLGAARGRRR
jgi:hypothetical protein